ncbi:MAG TPA: hypothetical protein VGJ13_03650 [Pseudonocardiaceae bacterium]
MAPHHARADRVNDEVLIRTLFATAPEREREREARDLIEGALSGGQLRGPDGVMTRWRLRGSRPSAVTAQEADHAQRFIHS